MIGTFYLLVFVVLAILVIAITVVYTSMYRVRINKHLASGEKGNAKVWSPMKVCIVSVIAALALCAILFAAHSMKTPAAVTSKPDVTVEKYTADQMQTGYLSQYSREGNAGYEKHDQVIGDIKYTWFVSKEGLNTLHPAFLIYAEYTGTDKAKYEDIILNFKTFSGDEIAQYTEGGCDFDGSVICLIGNASGDCQVTCIVDVYETLKNESEVDFQEIKNNNTALLFDLVN